MNSYCTYVAIAWQKLDKYKLEKEKMAHKFKRRLLESKSEHLYIYN